MGESVALPCEQKVLCAVSEPRSTGALVLICRSKFADDFNWVRTRLSVNLQQRFAARIHFVDVSTTRELVGNLGNPATLFDIAEVHVLIEYESGRFLVDALRDEFIQAGRIARTEGAERTRQLGIKGGEFLPETTVKVWYLTSSESPPITMLNEWSEYFGRRFFFLPLAQLKKQIKPRTKPGLKRAHRKTLPERKSRFTLTAFSSGSTLSKLIIFLIFFGVVDSLIRYQENFSSGDYDQIVSHEDSAIRIEELTSDLDSSDGYLIEHSWVFQRTRWDFTFFIASQWLERSAAELKAAGNNNGRGDQYWRAVYRRLMDSNEGRLDNVVDALEKHGRQLNLDDYDLASFVLSFVQHIPYKIPDNDLGLLAPPQTVRQSYGDCDSKSLLYVLILRKLGYDVAMYINRRLSHAMAGVSTPATGTFKSYRGVRYYFAETTSIGHRIGQLSSNWGGTDSWLVLPL